MIVSPPILIRYQYDIYAQSWGMVKTLASEPDSFKDIVVGKKNLLDIIKKMISMTLLSLSVR